MTRIVIDKKKYVLLSEKEYFELQLKAARKTKPVRILTLVQAKVHCKKLIDKWAAEKK